MKKLVSLLLVLSLALGLTACAPKEDPVPSPGADTTVSPSPAPSAPAPAAGESADVVVVGGGMAGMVASIRLSRLLPEAKIVLLEKNASLGGNLAYTGGVIMGFDEDYRGQASHTVAAPQRFLQCFRNIVDVQVEYGIMAKGDFQINETLLTKVFSAYQEAVDLFFEAKVPFPEDFETYGENTYSDFYSIEAGEDYGETAIEFREIMEGFTRGTSVDVRTGAEVVELLTENGAVVGALARRKDGTTAEFRAGSTVLATGGYAADPEMVLRTSGSIMTNYHTDSANNTGDGYHLAQSVGADIFDTVDCLAMNYYPIGTTYIGCWTYDLLFVTSDGLRHFDEETYVTDRTSAVLHMGYDHEYAILDEADYQLYKDDIDAGIAQGVAFKANGAEDLAKQLSMDSTVLSATIARYNELCDAGVDTDCGKKSEYLNKLEGDTLYAMKLEVVVTETYSGPRINTDAQVISTDGTPIPGLYAAGAVTLWQITDFHYSDCGSSILNSAVFGRQAAAHIIASSK